MNSPSEVTVMARLYPDEKAAVPNLPTSSKLEGGGSGSMGSRLGNHNLWLKS